MNGDRQYERASSPVLQTAGNYISRRKSSSSINNPNPQRSNFQVSGTQKEQEIPDYNALEDKHCIAYTNSKHFQKIFTAAQYNAKFFEKTKNKFSPVKASMHETAGVESNFIIIINR